MDFDVFDFVGRRVHLSDDDVFFVLELLGELVPNRSQLLTMAAPRSIEFYEDVFSRIFGDGVEVLAHENLCRRAIPISRDLSEGEEE